MPEGRGRAAVVALLIILAVIPGEYYVRWIAVVSLAIFLGALLVGSDVRLSYVSRHYEYVPQRRPEFERALTMVKRARKGGAKNLIEGELLEVHYLMTGRSYQDLRSNPPPALKAFYSSRNPYEGLEKALKILEGELNED